MRDSFRVRVAQASDEDAVRELVTDARLSLDFREELERSHAVFLVAEARSGEVVGLVLGWVLADEFEVLDVLVAEPFRRQGCARALLRELLAKALGAGAKKAFLEVRAANLPAQNLYLDEGFAEVGRRCGYYSDGEDALVLGRFLRSAD